MMKMKNLMTVILLVSLYQSVSVVFAKTAEEVQAERKKRDELQAATTDYNNAERLRTRAVTQQGIACAGDNSKSQACADATAKTLGLTQQADSAKDVLDSKAADATKLSNAAADKKEDQSMTCEAFKTAKKTAAAQFISTSQNENLDGDIGTSTMKKCVQISGNNMRYLHGKNKKEIPWKILMEASEECIAASPECTTDPNALEAKKTACANLKRFATRCDAAAYLIAASDRDWTNAEHVKTETIKGGNPAITCQGQGVATLDYEGCVKFVQNGDIMDAAQTAIQAGQELYYKDKTMTAQMEASQSTNSATAALEAMKTGVKSQQDIMTQRAALDTGKLAALASFYSSMPSTDSLKALCENYPIPDGLVEVQDKSLGSSVCSTAYSKTDFGILMNLQAREKMKAKLAQLGVNVASDALMAALAAKQAGKISDAIAKVESFKPIDPLAPAADNLQTTYCQQNPGDAKCLTGGLERTFDAMGDNVINFGEGGTGASYNNSNPFLDPTAGTTANAVAPTKSKIASVGNVISAAQQSSGLADKVDAANVTKGSAPAGGGGGGGSGGGGSGGGGGGGVPGAQPQGGVTAAIGGKVPNYNGGSLSVFGSGGGGLNRSKSMAKTDGNPFGSLFNKDGNKNGTINFRDPASAKSVGTKGDNLFDMISKRYTTVNSDKRLLEYELAK